MEYSWFNICQDGAHQSKTQFYSQPVPPTRKCLQASYPHPSEGIQNENHNHRKLIKLIIWTTTLSNSMKLWAMLWRANQDRRVMVERSDKTWLTGEGNGSHFSILALRTPWTVWKSKKITLKDELPRSIDVQYAAREEQRDSSRRNEEAEPKQKQCPTVDMHGGESKVQCCKEQYCIRTRNIRSMNQGKLDMGKQELARVSTTF